MDKNDTQPMYQWNGTPLNDPEAEEEEAYKLFGTLLDVVVAVLASR